MGNDHHERQGTDHIQCLIIIYKASAERNLDIVMFIVNIRSNVTEFVSVLYYFVDLDNLKYEFITILTLSMKTTGKFIFFSKVNY